MLERLLVLAATFLSVATMVAAVRRRRSSPQSLHISMRAIADALGFSRPLPDVPTVAGQRSGHAVTVSGRSATEETPEQALVAVTLQRPSSMRVGPEGLLPSFDFRTGDAAFDRVVRIQGEPDRLAAVLDAPVRAKLAEAACLPGFQLDDRRLTCRLHRVCGSPETVLEAVGLLLDLALLLDGRSDGTPGLLLANVRDDRLPAVRRTCAELLVSRHGESPEAAALPAILMDDPTPDLKLMGAELAGDERALGLWRAGLASRSADVRARSAAGLGGSGDPGQARVLAGMLPEPDAAVCMEIATALCRLGGDGAEDGLLALLQHPNLAIRLRAVRALAVHGTVRAVPPLLESAGEGGSAMRRQIRDAVDRIQARIGGAARGTLALAGDPDETGRLSPAPWDDAGALEVVEEGEEGNR